MSAGDRADRGELHTLARHVSGSHPEVKEFADQVMAEISWLTKRLAFAEDLTDRIQAAAAAAASRAARQSELLIEQADRLTATQAYVHQVTSLCDLAEWSAQTAGIGQPPSVLVDDLRRVLATAAIGDERQPSP